METITGLINNPWIIGIIVMMAVVTLGTKEILMAKGYVFKSVVRILNFPIVIIIILFFYVFSRIVINILSV